MQEAKEGVVEQYPTPEELWDLTFAEANAWRDRFSAVPLKIRAATSKAATIRTSPLNA